MLKIKTFEYNTDKKALTVTLQAECHATEMEGVIGSLAQMLKSGVDPKSDRAQSELELLSEPSKAEPEPSKAEPEPSKAEPEPSKAEPEPSKAEPEPSKAEPEPSKAEPEPSKAERRPGTKKPPEHPTTYDGEVVVHSRHTKNDDTILQLFGGKLVLLKKKTSGLKEAGRKDAPEADVAKHNLAHARRWEVGMDYYNRAVDAVEVLEDYNVRLTLCDGVRIVLGPDDRVLSREPPEDATSEGGSETDSDAEESSFLEKVKAATTIKDVVKSVVDSVGTDFDTVLAWCTEHKDQVPRLSKIKPERFENSIKRAHLVACG